MKQSLVILCVSSLIALAIIGVHYLFKTESAETAVACVLMASTVFSGIGILILSEIENTNTNKNDNTTK